MILQIWTVRDRKALAYSNPVCVHNTGVGLRSFADELVAQPQSAWALHPEDYEIFNCGQFDTESGKVSGGEELVSVALVSDLIPKRS